MNKKEIIKLTKGAEVKVLSGEKNRMHPVGTVGVVTDADYKDGTYEVTANHTAWWYNRDDLEMGLRKWVSTECLDMLLEAYSGNKDVMANLYGKTSLDFEEGYRNAFEFVFHMLDLPLETEGKEKIEEKPQTEIGEMPDPSVTIEEMHNYGYWWEGMLPIHKERAKELSYSFQVYILYSDDSEAEVDKRVIDSIKDGMLFGIHKQDWIRYKTLLEPENIDLIAEYESENKIEDRYTYWFGDYNCWAYSTSVNLGGLLNQLERATKWKENKKVRN